MEKHKNDQTFILHTYYHLRSAKYNAAHSGDITSAPDGACEFIDIDINSVLEHGGRYILPSVNSYTRQKFTELAECSGGWMIRQAPRSGEVFEPATVQDKMDITSEAQICIPVIIDLLERKVIWADLAMNANNAHFNNILGNYNRITLAGRALANIRKPTLGGLFHLHAEARGQLVSTPEEADTVFSVYQGIQPHQFDVIAAEFLADEAPTPVVKTDETVTATAK